MSADLELSSVTDLQTAQGWIRTRKERSRRARQALITKELEPAVIPLLEARIAAAKEIHAQARQAEATFFGGFGIRETPETPVSGATKAILADSEFFLSSFHEWRGDPRKDIWSTLSNKLLAKVR